MDTIGGSTLTHAASPASTRARPICSPTSGEGTVVRTMTVSGTMKKARRYLRFSVVPTGPLLYCFYRRGVHQHIIRVAEARARQADLRRQAACPVGSGLLCDGGHRGRG